MPELPPPISAVSFRRRLIRNYLAGTLFALTAGALLFTFGLDLTPRQTALLFFILVPLAFVPTISLDVWRIGREAQPVTLALAGAAEADKVEALVRALNLPFLTGRRIVLLHLPVFLVTITLLVALANALVQFGLTPTQYFNLLLIAVLVSFSHALFEYFGADRLLRPVTAWLWQRAGKLPAPARRHIIELGMQRKLLLVSLFSVFAPLAILGLTTLTRARDLLGQVGLAAGLNADDVNTISFSLQRWVIVLSAVSLVVIVALVVALAQGVTRSVKEMEQAMRRVEAGKLDTQLPVTTTDEFARLFEGFNLMTEGLHERERLRDAIGRYLAPELAEEVMKRGVQLGGQKVNATMLFADIRGFTTLSEKLAPEEVVDLLNRYFATVEPVIQAHGGWINKFGGDSLLAVFGAPVPHPDHARRAVNAALAMRAALRKFNREQAAKGEPEIQIGIGLHTGDVLAGNVGSPARMEYTVIGDVVNVASRIDGLNKDWGTDILVSADTWSAANLNGVVAARAMPPVALKGKTQLTQVYAIE
ncbi:MAG: adenylate/guanylate cyclase domain-containing protein [Anaerolineales bacterium]|nr:adenylate/guanylate cyclase domain-containing protein [Anaerolineales bacterium]